MILYLAPVTVFSNHSDLLTIRVFSCASLSATAPCFLRSVTVMPVALLRASASGAYQIGEVQARSCRVAATTCGGAIPSWFARIVVQRGVGMSNTGAL